MVYRGVNKPMAKVNDELCIAIYNKYKDVLDEIFDAVKNETPEKRKVKTSSTVRTSKISWKRGDGSRVSFLPKQNKFP